MSSVYCQCPETVLKQLKSIVEQDSSGRDLESVKTWLDSVLAQSSADTGSLSHPKLQPKPQPKPQLQPNYQTEDQTEDPAKDAIFKEMLTMEYIYDLIYGYASRITQLKSLEALYPLESPNHVVLLLMVDDFWKICEKLDNKQRYGIKRRILNVVRTTIRSLSCNAITTSLIGTDKIILLANLSEVSGVSFRDDAEAMGRALVEAVSSATRYSIKIGISNICKSHNDIWKAYEQSFQTLSHAFTFEKGVILHYSDLFTDKELDLHLLNETDRFEFELVKLISKRHHNETQVILSNWCSFLVANHYSEETIKSIFTKLIFNLLDYTVNIGLDTSDISKNAVDMTAAILKANSLTGIHQLVSSYVTNLSNQVNAACERGCERGFEAALAFIQTYYYESLTLEEVSKVANMSQSYFCRKFKEIYGMNYVKYLTEFRLEKSKQFIIESELSLSEIARKTGFSDLSYFSKLFKAHSGISPNKFRREAIQRAKGLGELSAD